MTWMLSSESFEGEIEIAFSSVVTSAFCQWSEKLVIKMLWMACGKQIILRFGVFELHCKFKSTCDLLDGDHTVDSL
jgi:hypothetical protein